MLINDILAFPFSVIDFKGVEVDCDSQAAICLQPPDDTLNNNWCIKIKRSWKEFLYIILIVGGQGNHVGG